MENNFKKFTNIEYNNINYDKINYEDANLNRETKNILKYEDWQLNIIRKYFKGGIIPKTSENIEDYLINTNISSIIKDLLGVIVARLNHGQSIHRFLAWLRQEEKDPFIEDIINSKSDEIISKSIPQEKNYEKTIPKVSGIERKNKNRVVFPKENGKDQLRDETGRNVYDILTYEEKIEFLRQHPEYTLDNLPRGFFKVLELERINIDFPNGIPSKSTNPGFAYDLKGHDTSIYEKIVNDPNLVKEALEGLKGENKKVL